MFVFQSIYAEFVTFVGSKKVKFKNGLLRTDSEDVAAHLRSKCKGVVTEIKQAAPKTEPKAADEPVDQPASKKSGK